MDAFTWAVVAWIGVAVVTLPVLLKVRAPYGRHVTQGWGPTLPNHWGWLWMELPALLVFPLVAWLFSVKRPAVRSSPRCGRRLRCWC